MMLHSSGVTCFGQLFMPKKGLSKPYVFGDIGSEKLCTQGHRDEHVTPLG
jgi:hypothetical protein